MALVFSAEPRAVRAVLQKSKPRGVGFDPGLIPTGFRVSEGVYKRNGQSEIATPLGMASMPNMSLFDG